MKFKFYLGLVFFSMLNISFANGKADMENMIRVMNKDNPEEYQAVLSNFISSAKEENVKAMLELTSDITKNKMGVEALKTYFKKDAIPTIKACKTISKGGDVIHIEKEQTGTGSGWVFRKTCMYGENKSIRLQFVILNENNNIVLTSVGLAPKK